MGETPHHDNTTQGDEKTPIISHSMKPSIKRSTRTDRSFVVPRSRAAGLILLWYFIQALFYGVVLNPDIYMEIFGVNVSLIGYVCNALLHIFYPLSGFLADVRFGRYKTVVTSIWMIFGAVVISIIGAGIITGVGVLISKTHSSLFVSIIVNSVIGSIFGSFALILLLIGFAGFNANVVQFGVDQLHDTPAGDTSLFIHWYVLLFYLSTAIAQILWSSIHTFSPLWISCASIIAIFFCIMPISLYLGHCRRDWFLIEPGQRNPYKLVYKVVRFAIKHKYPVDRSAFTYCEDELPSRMDLGKDKYGGPFSTEQVEDVKALFGILQVLLALGPFFAIQLHSSAFIRMVGVVHGEGSNDHDLSFAFKDSLSSILGVVFISMYIFLLRPFISHCIPSMLKRIGLGMIFLLISLLCIFSVNTAEMVAHNDPICILNNKNITLPIQFEPPSVGTTMLVLTQVLSAIENVFIRIAIFEFICAQAPYSMKGLLIGFFLTIEGVFQLIGIGIGSPFVHLSNDFISTPVISYAVCGFGYYLVLIIIALVSLVIYIWVAKRYKFRQRDEPSNLHRYAEEYYSNIQQERHYDYDDD